VGAHGGAGWYPDPAGGPKLRYFDGTTWTNYYQHRMFGDTAQLRNRRAGPLFAFAVILFFELGGVLCLWLGFSHLWGQFSGIQARVEVVACWSSGKNRVECTGVWRPADGTQRTVSFADGEGLTQGSTVDAHVHGNDAIASSLPNEVFSVVIPIVVGCGCVGVGVMFFRSWRADPPTRT
jgi:hypothetical protein